MYIFRLHTIRLTILLMLATGMVPFLSSWQTASAEPDEFTNWLTKLAKEDNRDQANDKIRELDTSHNSDVIRQASQLVVTNSEWFSLPLDGQSEPTDEEVYELIKTAWMTYQQYSSVSGEMAIERQHRPGWTPEKQVNIDSFWGVEEHQPDPYTLRTTPLLTSLQTSGSDSPVLTNIAIRGP